MVRHRSSRVLLAASVALVLAMLAGCTDTSPDAPTSPDARASSDGSAERVSPSTRPDAGPGADTGTISWKGCGGGFECGSLSVPLVADEPDQGSIDLALSRRPAEGPGDRIGSLVVNPGGPGASAVDYLKVAWTAIPPAVRAQFDLVAFDPRGVGASEPVRCASTDGLDAYFALDPTPDDAAELEQLVQGTATLVDGCDERSGELLPYLSTEAVAGDLDAVRAAVGDEELTYLGYSYGTSLGAAYLQAYPERVRAMVLDGGIDPTLTWNELLAGQSTGFDRALEAFLADCERTGCPFRQAVQGPLPAAFDALAAEVESAPLSTTGERDVGPGEFSLGVGAGLYDKASGWPAIAVGLAAAAGGDGTVLLTLSDSYLQRGPDGYANISEANLAVNCLDRPWPRDTAAYIALAERVGRDAPRFGPAIALSGLACADWPVPPAATPRSVRGEGAPPVVVIGTTGDPATPYAWSVALAEGLDSGVLLTHRGDGHTVYRLGAPACIQQPVDAYLLAETPPAKATC